MDKTSDKIFFIKDIISKGSYKEAYTISNDIPGPNKIPLFINESKLNGYSVDNVICLLIDYDEPDIENIVNSIADEITITYDMYINGIGPNIIHFDIEDTVEYKNQKYKYYLCERFTNNISLIIDLPKNISIYFDKIYKDIFEKISLEGYIYLDPKIEHIFYTLEDDSNYKFKLIDFDPQFCYKFLYSDGLLQSRIMMVLLLCQYLKYNVNKNTNINCIIEIQKQIDNYVGSSIDTFIDDIFKCQDRTFAIKYKNKYTIADMYCHYLLFWTGIEWRQMTSNSLMDLKVKYSLLKEITNLIKM